MAYKLFSAHHNHFPEDIKIHFWGLDESVDELAEILRQPELLCVPPFSQFKSERRKQEWLAVRVLLQQVLPQKVHIAYEESGRPYLTPKVAEFSISHTKGVVSIALSASPVGIDVEQISSRALKVVDHFLQSDELEVDQQMPAELAAVFLWSAKESVYKLVDQPGTDLKNDIHLAFEKGDEQYLELTAEVHQVALPILVRCYQMDGFVLTMATYKR